LGRVKEKLGLPIATSSDLERPADNPDPTPFLPVAVANVTDVQRELIV